MLSHSPKNREHTLYVPAQNLLENKVVLVTGASRGIGRAVAKAFAAYGATVILLSRTVKDLESLYDEIVQAQYPQPVIYPFNLCTATPDDFDAMRRAIDQQFGRLDGVLHNAGLLQTLSPIEHYAIDNWYKVLQVNLNSVFLLSRSTLPLLKRSTEASIIFTCSEKAKEPKANWGAYAIASAGSHTLMQIIGEECENYTNIRSNSIFPNAIHTHLRAQAYPAEDHKRLTQPDAIVAAYLYLMGSDSKHLNKYIIRAHPKFSPELDCQQI